MAHSQWTHLSAPYNITRVAISHEVLILYCIYKNKADDALGVYGVAMVFCHLPNSVMSVRHPHNAARHSASPAPAPAPPPLASPIVTVCKKRKYASDFNKDIMIRVCRYLGIRWGGGEADGHLPLLSNWCEWTKFCDCRAV